MFGEVLIMSLNTSQKSGKMFCKISEVLKHIDAITEEIDCTHCPLKPKLWVLDTAILNVLLFKE